MKIDKICSGFETFINDGSLTEVEVIIIKWQYGYFGSFYSMLIEAYRIADTENKQNISKGFPLLVGAMALFDSCPEFWKNCELLAGILGINKRQ